MGNRVVIICTVMLAILSSSALAMPYGAYKGYLTIDGTAASRNTPILVYVGGTLQSTYYTGDAETTANYFVIGIDGSDGQQVIFKPNGIAANEDTQVLAAGIHDFNLTMNKSASGGPCTSGYSWSDLGCAGSLVCCSSNVCAASCAVTTGGGGGGGMVTNAPPKKNATSETPKKETPKTPKQLLDVKLTLESNRLIDSTELVALTTFQSFGTAPAEVNLTYTFFDGSGKEIYNETDHQVVYTELALERKFDKLVLGAGNYSLTLTVEYTNVTERFRQDFEVLPAGGELSAAWLSNIYILIFSFILTFAAVCVLYKVLSGLKNG